MVSRSGRFVITYNGEVYNFDRIREELADCGAGEFRGHSDTEVILTAIETWGLEKALERFIGMFALGLWDREERSLTLVRDRVGIKPLYYGLLGGAFGFASELKALREVPGWELELDRDAVAGFLRHNYIGAPNCIWRGVRKLLPGHFLRISLDHVDGGDLPEPVPWWEAAEVVRSGRAEPFSGSPEDAVDELERLLGDAVSQRMISDVPLGAFLSGGIDSSAVLALMQSRSSRPIQSFSIGFRSKEYNEANYAREVAQHLGTDHHELYVSEEEAMRVVPDLPEYFDEPFSDSSQIPTHLVSRMARDHVTVALSGDGGDELFCGYTRYNLGYNVWRKSLMFPRWARTLARKGIRAVRPDRWDQVAARVQRVVGGERRLANPGYKLQKLAELLEKESFADFYRGLVSHWPEPEKIVVGATERFRTIADPLGEGGDLSPQERMMFLDLLTYLPDDILTKVDRASMAVSLEARVPILDHRVVEFAWSLPHEYHVRDGNMKWVLRKALGRHVPAKMFERPKMGFSVPLSDWLRGDLRDWGEELLSESRLKREGIFEWKPIREKWEAHVEGRANWQYWLWDILMFQSWHEKWKPGK